MSGGGQEKGAKSEYSRATMLKSIGKKVEKLISGSRLLKNGRVGVVMGRGPVFGRSRLLLLLVVLVLITKNKKEQASNKNKKFFSCCCWW